MNRLWIIGNTESPIQKQTHARISGTTADDFYYNLLSLKGILFFFNSLVSFQVIVGPPRECI